MKSIVTLVAICAVVTVVLALTNAITAPIIEANDAKAANAALLEVLPDGGSFTLADTAALTLPATVTEVYTAENGGTVVRLSTTGYASGMALMVGITPDGTVSGTKLIASQETPSIGGAAADTFSASVVGGDITTVESLDTISGATKTTAAYKNAVRDALNTVIILGGGSVDLRTEEEILADALNEALPAANGAFTKHFFVEVTEGVDAIYFADNGAGAVCVVGTADAVDGQFIALDASYTVITACDEAVAQNVKSVVDTVRATATTALDLTAYEGLPEHLVKADKTATGNYIMEIKAAGYGIVGGDEYHPASGEYIMIRVSVTPDGRVIDCLTLSEEETDGIGSACADETFYGQFDGKTEETYQNIDAISGATLTTDGYKKAILRAFACVKIFEGGDPS
ncbi:MAG: FMN-binding protein, partial [Clostridia bacterium]|nr:FMN-binding protein [Clostridia bacterium]